ncbi:MAG: AGE family epimerase/isomerase, partial [Bacteroidota bacterium]
MSLIVPNWHDLHSLYAQTLTENIIPFWQKFSPDEADGGYFTCLLRDGTVFDTDKFIWLQAREVWMFSKLYNEWEANPSWLKTALHGADFLEKYGRNMDG